MKDKKVIIINKKTGETPLDCILKLKRDEPDLLHLPITYAGRLDPLASGVIILLIGDECHKKDEYLKLTKEYEVEILFGFSTDTYDLMGLITSTEDNVKLNTNFDEAIREALSKFKGEVKQYYPPYSSRTVKGKPLFKWAREGKLKEIDVPFHNVFINSIKIIDESKIIGSDLLKNIYENISLVSGDFRQSEILSLWQEKMKGKEDIYFKIVKFKINCESGVYVRSIANSLGEDLGVPALAFKITRTKIGNYSL